MVRVQGRKTLDTQKTRIWKRKLANRGYKPAEGRICSRVTSYSTTKRFILADRQGGIRVTNISKRDGTSLLEMMVTRTPPTEEVRALAEKAMVKGKH